MVLVEVVLVLVVTFPGRLQSLTACARECVCVRRREMKNKGGGKGVCVCVCGG